MPLTFPFALQDGFNKLLGVQVIAWGPGAVTLELGVRDALINPAAVVNGGALASLIDSACTMAGSWFDDPKQRRVPVTLTLTTNFLTGAKQGPLTCTARRSGGGDTTFMAEAEVTDGAGRLVATGRAVMRYVGGPR